LVVAVGFGLVLTMPSLSAGVGDDPLEEYQVKAAFLYNFAKFVQWPAGAFRDSSDPIVICILGEDPFGRSLEDTVAGRKVDGRTLTVRHISSIRQSPHCHVLFVSSAEQRKSAPDLDQIRSPGILTIGESGTSAPYGSVITFKLESGKVRFDINVEAAEREKLKISSRLLSLGHVVDPRK
jgi:hypothetical protein